MEKEVKLKTKDGHIIYGVLNEPKKKTEKIIVVVHGLGSRITDHHYFNASRFFPKRGFSVLRVALYGHQKGARDLTNATIDNHIEDLNQVLEHVKKRYKKIFLVGHSFGGPLIARVKNEVSQAVVLWDPSALHEISWEKKNTAYVKSLGAYVLKWGVEILVSKEIYKNRIRKIPLKKWLPQFMVPTKVICAGKGILYKHWKKNMKHFAVPAEYVGIENADHNFNQLGAEEELFKETLKWIRKYS